MVRHCWQSGSIFALKFYWHEAQLVVRRLATLYHILTIREGVTQEDPVSMFLYEIDILPLTGAMQEADQGVFQPWYADNAAMRGPARRNAKILRELI